MKLVDRNLLSSNTLGFRARLQDALRTDRGRSPPSAEECLWHDNPPKEWPSHKKPNWHGAAVYANGRLTSTFPQRYFFRDRTKLWPLGIRGQLALSKLPDVKQPTAKAKFIVSPFL